MRIHLLPDAVINRIAAGEVVDRPAAVVRELVDNAVDAGATEINIELEQGGKNLIRVSDNGCGMSASEAELAIQRHATSKITDDSDLQKIQTLGFRGEALPSIASVSRMQIKTRDADSATAVRLTIEAGVVKEVQTLAAAVGSEVLISNLFFNTPARKKFLKSDATEERYVLKWLQSYALAHPSVKFRAIFNGKEVFLAPAVSALAERARATFGKKIVTFSSSTGAFSVEGHLGHPGLPPESNIDFTVIVNERLISDRAIFRAVKDAYGSMLKHFESPVGVIKLTLPGWMLDVNVHPQKSEVRFRSSGEIFKLVFEAVSKALSSFRAEQLVDTSVANVASNAGWIDPSSLQTAAATQVNAIYSQPAFGSDAPASASTSMQVQLFQPATDVSFSFKQLNFKAQVLGCFLVCEYNQGLVLIDLHAAHERINFNLIRKQIKTKKVQSQILLIPESLRLGVAMVQVFAEHQRVLESFGFEIDIFAEDTLVVRAQPSILGGASLKNILIELLGAEAQLELSASYERMLDYVAARLACHASLRSGDIIKAEEAQNLFAQLDSEEAGAACPHGRPILVQFSRAQVETWFGR